MPACLAEDTALPGEMPARLALDTALPGEMPARLAPDTALPVEMPAYLAPDSALPSETCAHLARDTASLFDIAPGRREGWLFGAAETTPPPRRTMPRQSATQKLARNRQMVFGIQRHLASMPHVQVAGRKRGPAELADLFQRHDAAIVEAQAAEVAWRAAVKRERALDAEAHLVAMAIVTVARLLYGPDVVTLADFGTAPIRKGTKTPEVLKRAAEKMRATRKARHTMGRRQRAKVKA